MRSFATRLFLSIAAVLIGLLLPGTAHAAAFSIDISAFPGGGVYIPTGADVPTLIYDTPALPAVVAVPKGPGIVQYEFSALVSPSVDPAATFAFGFGTMVSIEGAAGELTTCWSLGCSPDPGSLFPFFEATDLGTFLPLFRADPDTAQDDPGRQSTGTIIAIATAGGYQITSFFDLFIESYDAGLDEWRNVDGAVRYELFGDPVPIPEVPEPGTFALMGSGLVIAARAWHVRRRSRR